MTTDASRHSLRSAILVIALLSASLLAYQVLLTRVCALRLHFHFGFLVISNSLLGIGASGSLLALFERRWRLFPDAWIWCFCLLYLLSLLASWAYLLQGQIPETLKFDSWAETWMFARFNFACAVPFFFGGTAVGLILSTQSRRIHTVYAADLLGAGVGCLLCPLLLREVGAGGCFLAAVILGLAACTANVAVGLVARVVLLAAAAAAGALLPSFDREFPVPGKRWLDLTASHTVAEFGLPVFSQWSANSRIDVLPLPEGKGGFLQARGQKAKAMPLPRQWWIGQDGDAGTFLSDFGSEPDKLELLRWTSYSASFALKQGSKPRVLVIGVGGAPDLWAAKIHDASLIRGIELNDGVLDVHRTVGRSFSQPLLDDPRVELIWDEGRSALMRSDERYDVIQLTGIDTWTALNSGAYVLAENYLYTVQACRAMYDRLTEGGILQITRMAAGMETIRLLDNLYTALPAEEQPDFAHRVAALRTDDYLVTVLLKKGAFTDGEALRLGQWAAEAAIDVVLPPGAGLPAHVGQVRADHDRIAAEVTRRYADLGSLGERLGLLGDDLAAVKAGTAPAAPLTQGSPEDRAALPRLLGEQAAANAQLQALKVKLDVGTFVTTEDQQAFVDSYPFDVSPTTDDRPYFFSFLRWRDPEQASAFLHQPTWVVQGNPLFLRKQLLFSALAAAVFILLPLLFRRGTGDPSRRGSLRLLCYFAGLGVGFIGIEVALIQKFTLLLGLPLYSIVVTLCAILVFTGIGSLLSQRLLLGNPRKARWIPLLLLAWLLLLALGSEGLVAACIGLPLWLRVAVVALLTAPAAVLLGMPFAHGIGIVERLNPSLVPWAWAVNGSMTVIGSILTVIVSMNFGFAAVLVLAGIVYLIAFAAIDTLAREGGGELAADDGEAVAALGEAAPADPVAVEPQ